ncbi:MAG: putative porin [Bacteroidia bacterium]|nr:putative porin [Bacteroidia bacterium]
MLKPKEHRLILERGVGVVWALIFCIKEGHAQTPRILSTLSDTSIGEPVRYTAPYLPWYEPLDTLAAFSWRTGYFKPYQTWWRGVPKYESEILSFSPASQEVYLLRSVPLFWSHRPYTRVRFDQSSRRTQLLAVQHGQTFERRGGLSFAYGRRTREGEYLGQSTDHYTAGIAGYAYLTRWNWLQLQAGWNQLQDQLNGGVVYDSSASPWDAFGKERQRVRIPPGMRWRRWYRFLKGSGGMRFTPSLGMEIEYRLTEDRLQSESPFIEEHSSSTFFPDSLERSWGVRQYLRGVSLTLYWNPYWRGSIRIQQLRSILEAPFTSFRLRCLEGESMMRIRSLRAFVLYRLWRGEGAPAPYLYTELSWKPSPYGVGALYISRNPPWLAYQYGFFDYQSLPNERIIHVWGSYSLGPIDSTHPSLQFFLWHTTFHSPWLWIEGKLVGAGMQSYGLTMEGGVSGKRIGLISGVNLQQLYSSEERAWQEVLPLASGWIQPFVRWQLPGRIPVYQIGLRLQGFSSFRPLNYETHLGIFFLSPSVPLQGEYVWIDPYLLVHIRQVMVYLRVERATEGLLRKGYYLTAWYPMPGRAFTFGVQWDVYD